MQCWNVIATHQICVLFLFLRCLNDNNIFYDNSSEFGLKYRDFVLWNDRHTSDVSHIVYKHITFIPIGLNDKEQFHLHSLFQC